MSSQDKPEETNNPVNTNNSSIEIIEIDLQKLTDTQKLVLFSVLGSLLLQIIYLLNLGNVSDLMKNFIPKDYKIVSDYVRNFLITFIPYLVVIFFVVAIFIAYQLLLNNKPSLELGAQIFDFSGIIFLASFVLFFISIVTINPTPSTNNEAYPNSVELFLFVMMIVLTIVIAFIPFYIQRFLDKRIAKPQTQINQVKQT